MYPKNSMDFIKNNIFSSYKRGAGIIFVAILALAIPITLTLISQQQDVRQRAAGEDICNSPGFTYSCSGQYIIVNGSDRADCGPGYACQQANSTCVECVPTSSTISCGITECNSSTQTCLIDGLSGVATCVPIGTSYVCNGNTQNVPCAGTGGFPTPTAGPTPTPLPTLSPINTCPTTTANPSFSFCGGSTVTCSWTEAQGNAWSGEIYTVVNGIKNQIVCSSSWGNGQVNNKCKVDLFNKELIHTNAAPNMQYGCTIGSTCNSNLTSSANTCTLGSISGPTATPFPSIVATSTPKPTPTPQEGPKTWTININPFCTNQTDPTKGTVTRYRFTQGDGTCKNNKMEWVEVPSTNNSLYEVAISYNPATDGNCSSIVLDVKTSDVNAPFLAPSSPTSGITVGFNSTIGHSAATWNTSLPTGTYSIKYETPESWCSPTTPCTGGAVCTGTCTATTTNTCGVNNGKKTGCQFTTTLGGVNDCKPVDASDQTCTVNACIAGNICSSGACVTPTPTKNPLALKCDLNKDNKISILDYGEWANQFTSSSPLIAKGDCNGDGKVSMLDYGIWVNEFLDPSKPH